MAGQLEGKVILVTGATSGIGREAVLEIVREGGRVAFTGRREDKGKSLEAEVNALSPGSGLFIQADHANEADSKRAVETTVETFGSLRGAFNNAGVEGTGSPTHEASEDNYRHTFDINVWGVLNSMKHEIPAMLKSGGGSIVNTSSTVGKVAVPGAGVYVASKHAVEGLSKAAALDYAEQGIRVNTVAPALIKTEMADRFTGGDPEAMKVMEGTHPVGRAGEPSEVVGIVVLLLSDKASFMTGQSYGVDGGWLAR